MENKKTSPNYALIAGILFAATAAYLVVSLARYLIHLHYWSVYQILAIVAYIVLAFAFIKKQRNILPVVGFALLAIRELIGFDLFLDQILGLLSALFAAVFCFGCLTDYLPKHRETIKKLWFLPPILFVVSCLSQAFDFGDLYWRYNIVDTLLIIAQAAGMLFAMLWCAYPDGLPKPTRSVAADGEPTASAAVITDRAYCGLVKHVLLLLFTCGIWHLIWIYRMTDYTNAVNDEEPRNPTTKLLLCMFIPFYAIYWVYKTAQRVDKMAAVKGIASDMATLCLILEIFIPIVPAILLQDKLNKIVTTKEMQPVRESVVKESTTQNVAEELKTFKELLDSGIITQEEFDAKKKELLGL